MTTIESTLQSVLGGQVSGRAYPLSAPDPVVKPYVVYQVIHDGQVNSLSGWSGQSNKRVQVDVYASTYGGAKTLADSIKTAMAASALNNIHLFSRDQYESKVKLYRVIMDFSIWS